MAHTVVTAFSRPEKLSTNSTNARLQAAKKALAAAENKQGLRSVVLEQTQPGGTPYTLEQTRTQPKNPFRLVPERTTTLNPDSLAGANNLGGDNSTAYASKLGNLDGAADTTAPNQSATNNPNTLTRQDRDAIPVHPALTHALPHGLARGAITTTHGSTYIALTLIAHHTQNNGWAAIVGAPNINYTTLQDLGAKLNHIITIPHPGDKTPEVIAALIEGTDLILLGPRITLTASEQRTLTARNRERGTHIITQTPWKGARTHLTAQQGPWQGTRQGLGRLTATNYTLTTTRHHQHHTTTLDTVNGTPKVDNAITSNALAAATHTNDTPQQPYRKEKTG